MGKKVNQRELAEICGKSVQAVQKWQGDGMPVKKHGSRGKESQYDTADVISWLLTRQAEKKQSEYDIERTRLARAQATKTELEVALLEGVSIDARDMEPAWLSLALHIRNGFLNFAGKLAPRLAQEDKPEVCQKILQTEIDDILSALGNEPPEVKSASK